MTGYKKAFVVDNVGTPTGTFRSSLIFNGETLHGIILHERTTLKFGVAVNDSAAMGNVLRYPEVTDPGASALTLRELASYLVALATKMDQTS